MEHSTRNKTLVLSDSEQRKCADRLLILSALTPVNTVLDKTLCQNMLEALDYLPVRFVDLLFLDPPYNLDKTFNSASFKKMPLGQYGVWMEQWLPKLLPLLKPTASIYVCADWRSSQEVYGVLEKYFVVQNRITWEREKGRGALHNWKNCTEDVWFCTCSTQFTFNLEAVKLRRRVIAPYTDLQGNPKDWQETSEGQYRLTHPSNIWTDLTVPFWSMPENTNHPTQKPEKLLAKIILASSNPGDVVLDPFLGSGTTSVVAKKLDRHYVGIEWDQTYACLAEKRLEMADADTSIQGYRDGVFWERNSLPKQTQRCYAMGL